MFFRFTWSGIKLLTFRLLCYSIIKMPHRKKPNWWSKEIRIDKNLRHLTPFPIVKILRKWGRKTGRHWKSYNHLGRHKHQNQCPAPGPLLHPRQSAEQHSEEEPALQEGETGDGDKGKSVQTWNLPLALPAAPLPPLPPPLLPVPVPPSGPRKQQAPRRSTAP